MAVDERALESEPCNRTFELLRGLAGIRGRQCGKPAEARRMRPDGFEQPVVGVLREGDGTGRFVALAAGSGSEITWKSIPAASIAASRMSEKSSSPAS
jgi:hypothetical protein